MVSVEPKTASAFSALASSHGYVVEQVLRVPGELDWDTKPAAIVLSAVETGVPALNVLVWAKKKMPPIPVVVLVPPDQARVAVEALKLGAIDALVTPVDPEDILSALRSALTVEKGASAKSGPEYPLQSPEETAVFVSRSQKMLQIWNVATTVARTDVPVLILGESGVGKEVLARYIHRHSKRADEPILKVNCAALPHDLLESELFGYERGAFTGAVGEKPGKFELADKGCILLDEIGEMPPSLQAKLLHVLEGGEFSRLGAKRPTKVDVRVIALTNRKLHEAIPRGEFRDDLYFRLSVVKISIPPLRDRKEDVPLLCSHFLRRYRATLDSSIEELPPQLIDAFMKFHWPGNVRQLENTIRRYLILPDADMELDSTAGGAPPRMDPPEAPKRAMIAAAGGPVPGSDSRIIPFPSPHESVSLKHIASMAAEHAEQEMVLHVLQQTNWNRSQAARRLNICYRALLNKLKKWQVNRPRAS